MRRFLIVVPSVLLLAGLAACGGSGGGSSSSGAPAPTTSSAPTSSAAPNPKEWGTADCESEVTEYGPVNDMPDIKDLAGIRVSEWTNFIPLVAIQQGLAPATNLGIYDISTGTGEFVTPQATVRVKYCGIGQTSRKVFVSTARGNTEVDLEWKSMIPGLQGGLVNMRDGGHRVIVVPGELAYGNNPPAGSGLAPNETVIFVVDLVSWVAH